MTKFKEALERYDELGQAASLFELGSHNNTIRRALLIADLLMQEPSEGAVDECVDEEYLSWHEILKAMRDQLIREIENANQ